MDEIRLANAISCCEEARRALISLYLDNPADEEAVATTPVPAQFSDLSLAVHSTYEHLLNLRDFPQPSQV